MSFKDLLQHRIIPKKELYKCFLCHFELTNNLEDVKQHLFNYKHKKLFKEFNDEEKKEQLKIILRLQESECQFLVENEIALAKKNFNYRCYLCSIYLSSLTEVKEHINSFVHKKNFGKIVNNEKNSKGQESEFQEIKKGQEFKPCYFEQIHTCLSCRVALITPGLVKYHCMLHLFQSCKYKQDDIIQFDYKENNIILVNCKICQKTLDSFEELEQHLDCDKHLSRKKHYLSCRTTEDHLISLPPKMENFENIKKFETYNNIVRLSGVCCKVCNEVILESNIMKHAETKEHCKNLLKKNSQISSKKKKVKVTKSKKTLNNTNKYMCFLCIRSYADVIKLFQHYESDNHVGKTIYMQDILGSTNKLNKNVNGQKMNQITEKNETSETNENTLSKYKNLIEKFKTSEESLCSTTSSQSTPNETEKIPTVGTLDLNKLQRRKLTLLMRNRKPREPKNEKIDDSSSYQNILNFGKSFIKYCIDPGEENIYNSDSEKLRLLKLGIYLTIPWKTETICLPCSETFPLDRQLLFEHLQSEEHINNLYEMERNDKYFEEYPNQSSDLKLAIHYMKDQSDKWVHCYICNINVKNEDEDILLHIDDSNHLTRKQLLNEFAEDEYQRFLSILKEFWYFAQIFACKICEIRIENDINFVKHLEDPMHLQKVMKLKNDEETGQFYVCPICTICWYGTLASYNLHCQDKFHKSFTKTGNFTIPDMPVKTLDLLTDVDNIVDSLLKESNEVMLQNFQEIKLAECIRKSIKRKYRKADVFIFGSRYALLGLPNDTLDVVLDCENLYFQRILEIQKSHYYYTIKPCFINKPELWNVNLKLTKLMEREKVINLQHIPTDLKCNIYFVNGHVVKISRLLRYYNKAYPICRKLILFLRKWSVQNCLFGLDYPSIFNISWCVIFYLQTINILPTVQELVKLKHELRLGAEWENELLEKVPIERLKLNFKNHLAEFFTYFAHFDYQREVVCPYVGKSIKKSSFCTSFAHNHQFLQETEIYKFSNIDDMEQFEFYSPMCVQDPLAHSENLAKGITKQEIRCFRQYCKESSEKLNKL